MIMSIHVSTGSTGWRSLGLLAVISAGLLGIVGSGGGLADGCSFLVPAPCTPDFAANLPPPGSFAFATLSPQKRTVQAGGTAVFTVNANGMVPTVFRWDRSRDGGRTFTVIPAATSGVYTQTNVPLIDDGSTIRVTASTGPTSVQMVATALLTVTSGPAVVFEDGDFDPAGWSVDAVVSPLQGGATHTEEQVVSAGHPDAWRRMVDRMPPGLNWLQTHHVALAARYEPALQGAIVALDYSEDCIFISGAGPGDDVQAFLLVEQAGRNYVHVSSSTTCQTPGWAAMESQFGLLAADFVQIDGPACAVGQACPDFSVAGAALRFGYARTTQSFNGQPAVTVIHGIDNWRVAVWRR
jgi:hypothetical protein